ncbi:hypothetical protein SARC_05735 [Sphaeroforma arctica JP610]|uniref:Methyltransferase type 11 domain-containing protein n=1 Tax=Sphaeroforma arctica JP610 TaxID=667725 RepID=A0A0L0FZI3_9EUKA|nr:hypothetical protein SARC_05735 [Sphaeroforma arctica JP610]KNC81971.1 hypothetical protein SARC_05735 [Sphaeroforma arctica JP610]|eukprot:XP_014155873.1 hypothetical protein SARC_05735 [Sphaeroforma arctica JP610]
MSLIPLQTNHCRFVAVALLTFLCIFVGYQWHGGALSETYEASIVDVVPIDTLSEAHEAKSVDFVPTDYMCSNLHCYLEPALQQSYLLHRCDDERVASADIPKVEEASAIKQCATKQCQADKTLLASFSGAWCPSKLDKYYLDEGLATQVLSILHRKNYTSLYDFGAGVGRYVNFYREGDIDALGFDGNLGVEEYTQGKVINRDFTSNELLNELQPREVVTCFETGEHVPKSKESSLLDIVSGLSTRMVVMSWAKPGQGGVGHINLQKLDYIIAEMDKRGCVFDAQLSKEFNEACTLSWFKTNLFACIKIS